MPVATDVAEALQQRARVGQRAVSERLERLREVAGEHRRGELRQEHLAGGHGVQRNPGARPVADLDLVGVRRLDLVDVLHRPAVADGHAGGLAELGGQLRDRGAGNRDDVPRFAEAGRDREEIRPEAVAPLTGDLFDGSLGGEGSKQACGGRFRDVGRGADLADPERPICERTEHGEGAPDALDADRRAGHGTLGWLS
jgi:hypothetical protein